MNLHQMITRAALVVLPVLMPAFAAAQPPVDDKGTVTGTGFVDLKRQPDVLRVQVEVLAKGKDLKEALAKLKERRGVVEKQLAQLGAAAGAVAFAEPQLSSDKTDRQRQMEMMVRERLNRKGPKPDAKAKQPPAVVVAMGLKAEFPLKAATPEEFLMAASELQDKIKAADLAGMKDIKSLSPQEEELADESGAMSGMGMDNEPPRGEPMFMFVSKISEEDHAKVLAEAFQRAKKEAARLAKAAGSDLDSLHHLNNSAGPTNEYDESAMYDRMSYYRMSRMRGGQPADDHATEAIGLLPGKATYRVTVTASFSLKKPTEK